MAKRQLSKKELAEKLKKEAAAKKDKRKDKKSSVSSEYDTADDSNDNKYVLDKYAKSIKNIIKEDIGTYKSDFNTKLDNFFNISFSLLISKIKSKVKKELSRLYKEYYDKKLSEYNNNMKKEYELYKDRKRQKNPTPKAESPRLRPTQVSV